jgi:hypothetical protein
MNRIFLPVGLLVLALFAAVRLSAAAQKEDGAAKDAPAKPNAKTKKELSEKPISRFKGAKPDVLGKLLRVEGAQRYIAVQVTYRITLPNPSAALNIANLRQQLVNNRDRSSIMNIQLDIARNQANLWMYREEKQKIEMQLADDLKVRTLQLPLEYDDKGKVRRLTEKEKKELRGDDPNLPGYNSDFESLKQDQIVEIYLDKSKEPAKPKAKDKDEAAPSQKPIAIMIVIRAEPPR